MWHELFHWFVVGLGASVGWSVGCWLVGRVLR